MNQTDNLLKIIFNDAEAIKTFKKQGNKGDMISKIWETPFFQVTRDGRHASKSTCL